MALALFTFDVTGNATRNIFLSCSPPVIVYKFTARRTHRERIHDTADVFIGYQDYELMKTRKMKVLQVSILDDPPSTLREHVDEMIAGMNAEIEPECRESMAEVVIMRTLDIAEEHNRTCNIIVDADLEIHTEEVVYMTSPPASESTRQRLMERAFKVGPNDDPEYAGLDDSCSVCLEEFGVGMELIKTQCDHIFHKECILRWLEYRNSCPICRIQYD